MAAVSISPSPKHFSIMTSRRVPLANVPNAANSPRRAVPIAGTKRHRANAADQRESQYGQPPPAKKQILEAEDVELRATARGPKNIVEQKSTQQNDENALQSAVGRRSALSGKNTVSSQQKSGEQAQKPNVENLETIRQWQRHYRRVFPSFVFYFESIPEDTRQKSSRQIASLGAVRSIRSQLIETSQLTGLSQLERGTILFQGRHTCRHDPQHSFGVTFDQSRYRGKDQFQQ